MDISTASYSPGAGAEGEDSDQFIELSELDKLLGLPPPRFNLGAADLELLKPADNGAYDTLKSADSAVYDPEIEFAVPQRPRLDSVNQVSVIKSELNIGSDGQEVETECNSYLTELVPVPPLSSTSQQDEMLYNGNSFQKVRTKPWNRCSRAGTLNQVVTKLLARSDVTVQCLPVSDPICDSPIPKPSALATVPSPVLNKLKKLGTSVELEKPKTVPAPRINSEVPRVDNVPPGFRQIMESLDKAVDLTSDLTKKKKRRSTKKDSNNQVPSLNPQLLADIENSDHLAKFTFRVDAKQVIELSEGQKLYTCDICSGVYHRGFSLKRHYLKTHINYKHISKRDLHNCGILIDSSVEKGGPRKRLGKDDSLLVVSNLSPTIGIEDLYRCHSCGKCFSMISDLKTHLIEHPPVSVQNLNDNQYKNYSCPNCKARYQRKKLFLQHKEVCGVEVPAAPLVAIQEKSPKKVKQIKINKNIPEATERHFCTYCDKSFDSLNQRKCHNLQMHHPKKKLQQCYLCRTKMFKDRLALVKHLILHHPDEYIGCLPCKIRFGSREEFKKHNKENHKPLGTAKRLLMNQMNIAKPLEESSNEIEQLPENEVKTATSNNPNLNWKCPECPKMFASHLNMTRHHRIAHRLVKRKKKREQYFPKKRILASNKPIENQIVSTPPPIAVPQPIAAPPPPPPDPEVLFYSTVALNIRENLTHHLDGKLDSQEVLEYDLNKSDAEAKNNKVLNFSASFSSENVAPSQPEATSTPIQLKEPRFVPISPRGQWEKFNFPKNYDGRCGLTSYVKDMSHLDISTQLTMRRNLQRLNSFAGTESNKESPANIPAGLLLVEKPGPDCAETFGNPDDNKDTGAAETTELSGEWVRPRNYMCAACGYKSTNLWDTEDHKYAIHPNAWVPHLDVVGQQCNSAWDWIYHRRLPLETAVELVGPARPGTPPPCSKCGRASNSYPDLHWHMLDCGGDITWQATMLGVTSPGSRRRKWRPFGSRKRKQQGKRMVKRNIPNTPAKHVCGRIRTKPGDMDTIQKMIANLPAKRATRRVLGDELDNKTRNQVSINNRRILRRRRCSTLISSLSNTHHGNGVKKPKLGRGRPRLHGQKSWKVNQIQEEEKTRKGENEEVKIEPVTDEVIKEEPNELMEPMEPENMTQHSDILTSLQMIPVVRKSTETPVIEEPAAEEPFETSKIIAAMREAMLVAEEKIERKPVQKVEKKRRVKREFKEFIDDNMKGPDSTNTINEGNEKVIICNGCGMQFDSTSACQRHKKKCVYWKEDKNNEGNKSNKCVNCEAVFPYLMALLKHSCVKTDGTDEPAMPELCPEGLVEQVQGNSVEDIPILSPAEVTRDDEHAKKLSHVEATVNQVGTESFDVSGYYDKFSLPSLNCSEKNQNTSLADKKETKADPPPSFLFENVENQKSSTQGKVSSRTSSPKRKSGTGSNSNLKSPENSTNLKNKRVSEIFKEVKRRGRKKGLKSKIASTLISQKLHRKSNTTQLAMKVKKRLGKGRSSNFVMLMKEWEKLRSEGAVAEEGKRRRVKLVPVENLEHKRVLRRRSSLIRKINFDLDDFMSIPDSDLEYNEPKTKEKPGISSDKSKENAEEPTECDQALLLTDQAEQKLEDGPNVKEDKNLVEGKLKPGPKEDKNETLNKVKRKVRSQTNTLSYDTEAQINETIEGVLRRAMEEGKGLSLEHDQSLLKKKGKVSMVLSEKDQHLKKMGTKTIGDSSGERICQSGNNMDVSIFDVSVGTASLFQEKSMEELYQNISSEWKPDLLEAINLSEPLVKKKRGRPKGWKKYPTLSLEVSASSVGGLCNSTKNEKVKPPKSSETNQEKNNKSKASTASLNTDSSKTENIISSDARKPEKINPPNVIDEVSGKFKEIKTKQQLMDDYLIFKKYMAKKSLETVKKDVEVKATVSEVSSINEVDKEVKESLAETNKLSSINNRLVSEEIIQDKDKTAKSCYLEEGPSSPGSTSSKDDLALSVLRDRAIKKKKKKLKLKKMMKKKRLEIVDGKVCKPSKPKLPKKDKNLLKKLNKNKLKKEINKKVKVGVSRNCWEVSIVENKIQPLTVVCDDYTQKTNEPELQSALYAHKLQSILGQHENGKKPNNEGEEEIDPMKYCKSIGSIINDLEKRTLTVAKVMHHLKQEETGKEGARAEEGQSEERGSTAPDWPSVPQQDWNPLPLPLWESGLQSWDADSFTTSCSSSIGSIMDTVNKLLSSDQELASPSLGNYTWSDLQLAMGASDEEMAILEQLGEHTLQEEYVYDSSRPLEAWPLADDHTLVDLDHPESSSAFLPLLSHPSPTTSATASSSVDLSQPSTSDTEEVKLCRGALNQKPKELLADYDSKEMVCPTCSKHFLGLTALKTHVSWSHCTPTVSSTSKGGSGQKRRAAAMLSHEEGDRRFVCFVCKEILPSATLLESHIQAQHAKKTDNQETAMPTESAEKLRSKMSLALGSLVDRALNKLIGCKLTHDPSSSQVTPPTQAELNTKAFQLLGKLCAAQKRLGSENVKSTHLNSELIQLVSRVRSGRENVSVLASELRHVLGRRPLPGSVAVSKEALRDSVTHEMRPTNLLDQLTVKEVKPTNLLDHLAVCSSDTQERPYPCPICDLRFMMPSTRNRHIARTHVKYGERYNKEFEEYQAQECYDSDWKEHFDSGLEANDDEGEMLPLCSDCGLSFKTIHEVRQHRIEDHPRRFSAEDSQDSRSGQPETNSVVESSCENENSLECSTDKIKLLPLSDNAVDSTSSVKKKMGRPAKKKSGRPPKRKLSDLEQKSTSLRKRKIDKIESSSEKTEDEETSREVSFNSETSSEHGNKVELCSPEIDKFSDKSDKTSVSINSSEENLAELSKKLDRRKITRMGMGNIPEEAVRVKAEAALRELNLSKKNKTTPSPTKWGVHSMKFTKVSPTGVSSSQVNGSPSKPRFTSLVDKKWKTSPTAVELLTPKTELTVEANDVYDFRDEEVELNKKLFQQHKETLLIGQSTNSNSPSPKKTSKYSKNNS